MTAKTRKWITRTLIAVGVLAVVGFLAYQWLIGSVLRQLTNGQLVAADHWSDEPAILGAAQFDTVTYQMGGMILFPGRQIGRKWTINQERGCNSRIADRLDLTVECIRLHYLGEISPMTETLIRYGDFLALFEDFNGYINFFLLQDLVSEDLSTVRFFMPFADFGTSPLPPTVEVYQDYRRNAIRFVQARNRRMAEYVARL